MTAAAVLAATAPPDAVQGQWQRLMYLHVPSAWVGYAAFGLVVLASVAYLRTDRVAWERRALAATEIGVVATALTLATGSVWGRAVWGTWWAWDPRLVSTAVLFLVYLACLGLRAFGCDPRSARRRSAWLAVVGFVDVPIVHFSVVWWRTLHQPATFLDPTRSAPIDARMATALVAAVVAAAVVASWAFVRRVRELSPYRPVGPPVDPGSAAQRPTGAGTGRR